MLRSTLVVVLLLSQVFASNTICPTARPFHITYDLPDGLLYANSSQPVTLPASPYGYFDVLFTGSSFYTPTSYTFIEGKHGCQLSISTTNVSDTYRSVIIDENEKFADSHLIHMTTKTSDTAAIKVEELYCHTNADLRLLCIVTKANFPTQNVLGFAYDPHRSNENRTELDGNLLIFAPGAPRHSGYVPKKIFIQFQDTS